MSLVAVSVVSLVILSLPKNPGRWRGSLTPILTFPHQGGRDFRERLPHRGGKGLSGTPSPPRGRDFRERLPHRRGRDFRERFPYRGGRDFWERCWLYVNHFPAVVAAADLANAVGQLGGAALRALRKRDATEAEVGRASALALSGVFLLWKGWHWGSPGLGWVFASVRGQLEQSVPTRVGGTRVAGAGGLVEVRAAVGAYARAIVVAGGYHGKIEI